MDDRRDVGTELRNARYGSFKEIFAKFRELSDTYGGLPTASLVNAFTGAIGNDPTAQNKRVKSVATLPSGMSKAELSDMLKDPQNNERGLRQAAHALEYTAYPMFHTRKLYQELMTYHSYIAPHLTEKADTAKDGFWREWKLLEKLRTEMDLKSKTHEIAGQTLQEGKVFYASRVSVDKSHNSVNYAFLQQLPSDWVKIIGFNNRSKYTLAFNLMYFLQAGTDIRQFGDLFDEYLDGFNTAVSRGKNTVYASYSRGRAALDLSAVPTSGEHPPEAYNQSGTYFYWVTLPVDRAFTFEVDDVSRDAVSPFTGLFLDMIQLSQLEAIQLELVQNPLFSVLTGEIPYFDEKASSGEDQYKLSNAGQLLFQSLWYQMLANNNTGGLGYFAAPLANMELHTLSEAPSAMDIVSQGYTDTMAKAGLTGIIPVSDEARAGAVQVSLQIESRFAQTIYACMERAMNCIIRALGLKYEWKFHMFGDIATDKDLEDQCRQGMTLGILPETLVYDALHDRSILDDICWSDALMNSKLMDKRLPLVSSYSAKQENGLPPQAAHDQNPGGRPDSGGKATSDGAEGDLDSPASKGGGAS